MGLQVKLPTLTENDSRASEHAQAKWWRQHVVRLSIDALAEATGYSSRVVYLMELGCTAHGKKVKPWVWTRYKKACAAVHCEQGLCTPGKPFNWAIGQRELRFRTGQ